MSFAGRGILAVYAQSARAHLNFLRTHEMR